MIIHFFSMWLRQFRSRLPVTVSGRNTLPLSKGHSGDDVYYTHNLFCFLDPDYTIYRSPPQLVGRPAVRPSASMCLRTFSKLGRKQLRVTASRLRGNCSSCGVRRVVNGERTWAICIPSSFNPKTSSKWNISKVNGICWMIQKSKDEDFPHTFPWRSQWRKETLWPEA